MKYNSYQSYGTNSQNPFNQDFSQNVIKSKKNDNFCLDQNLNFSSNFNHNQNNNSNNNDSKSLIDIIFRSF